MTFNYDKAFCRNIGIVQNMEQKTLQHSRVAIAGAGGMGGTYAETLARMGVGYFTIADGDCFGFIGPNGAGKSTTIKVLATLINPDRGAVRIGGIDVPRNPMKIRRMIGYMPDFFGVLGVPSPEILRAASQGFSLSEE